MKIYNKRAKHDYHILETLEAGLVLSGPEVKSVRAGKVNLTDSFARIQNNEAYLKNAYIFPYQGQHEDYDPIHDRKLLLHRNQIETLRAKISGSATTLIPLSLYTTRNYIKVELALAASKKKYDKKRAIKVKDEQRRLSQELKW
jgi:SsrA-binding protein